MILNTKALFSKQTTSSNTSKPRLSVASKPTSADKAQDMIKEGYVELKAFSHPKITSKVEDAEAIGAKYRGSLVMFNANSDAGATTISSFCQAFDGSNIPEDWRPKETSHMALFSSVLNNCARSLKSLSEGSQALLQLERVTKFRLESVDSEEGVKAYRLFALKKTTDGDSVKIRKDVDLSLSVAIILKKIDPNGLDHYDNFSVEIDSQISDEDYNAIFDVFLKDFLGQWADKCHGYYQPEDISQIVYKMLRTDLDLPSYGRGVYLADPMLANYVQELKEILHSVNKSYVLSLHDLFSIPQIEATQAQIKEVGESVSGQFIASLVKLREEVLDLKNNDKDTRDTTWARKLIDLQKIVERTNRLREQQLFIESCHNDLMQEIQDVLGEHIQFDRLNSKGEKIEINPDSIVAPF